MAEHVFYFLLKNSMLINMRFTTFKIAEVANVHALSSQRIIGGSFERRKRHNRHYPSKAFSKPAFVDPPQPVT
jgi:hypothetical protein